MKVFLKTFLLFFALTLVSEMVCGQTVYVQESGKKIHLKNCSVAGTGKKGMKVSEAKKLGYEACKVCKPLAQKEEDKKTQLKDKPKK